LSHSTSHFIVLVFFKIGSGELFAWAGFKLWSSWVAGMTGMSHHHQAYWNILTCV
jgi:hypothetical protein